VVNWPAGRVMVVLDAALGALALPSSKV